MATAWLNPEEWWRAGQGRRCDLLLPREQVVAQVQAVAERAAGELDVILCDRVQAAGDRRYRSRYRVAPLQELLAPNVTNQFLRSRRLTPVMPPDAEGWDWAAACSLNGLILFQREVGSRPPNMGIVPCVENRATGKRLEHAEYDRLFQAIKRRVRRASATE